MGDFLRTAPISSSMRPGPSSSFEVTDTPGLTSSRSRLVPYAYLFAPVSTDEERRERYKLVRIRQGPPVSLMFPRHDLGRSGSRDVDGGDEAPRGREDSRWSHLAGVHDTRNRGPRGMEVPDFSLYPFRTCGWRCWPFVPKGSTLSARCIVLLCGRAFAGNPSRIIEGVCFRSPPCAH